MQKCILLSIYIIYKWLIMWIFDIDVGHVMKKKCIDSISLIYNWLIMWIFLIFDIDMHWQKKLSWSVKLINNMYMRNLTISHTNICIIFDKIVQYVYINFFKLFSLIYKYICMFFFSSYRSCQVHGYYDCGGHVDEWRNTCRMLCALLLSSGQLLTLTKKITTFPFAWWFGHLSFCF